MNWIEIFDIVRHIPQVLFFAITGPLAAIFAFKKIRENRDPKTEVLRLQKKMLEVAQNHTHLFKLYVVPMVRELDSRLKDDPMYLEDKSHIDDHNTIDENNHGT